MHRFVVVLALVVAACSSSEPPVQIDDTLHRAEDELARGVDNFVASGRTALAYPALVAGARRALAIDPRIAADVELRLVSLALHPVLHESHDALASTVWPTLLAESSATLDQIVPELRTHVMAARTAEAGLARMKRALAACVECTDDGWRDVRRGWESADRSARAALADVDARSHAHAWPTAGLGSTEAPHAVEIEVGGDDIAFAGLRYRNEFRVAVLRDVRERDIAFVIPPGAPTRLLTALLRDARAAGMQTITLLARDASLERRAYAVSTSLETTTPDASIQAFLRRYDAAPSVAMAR